jgi:hypothetical protein
MKRQMFLFGLAVVALSIHAGIASTAKGGTIAHWSFDSSTLTTDGGGNITGAADSTGNHDATLGAGVGSASVANGGPTFNSNTIPGANSVAGQFGEGLTLTGNNNFAGGGGQFLMFPNLTELMTANSAPGAPSYSVSYWIKTTTTNSHQYTILGDWGNAATNPGRFKYGFGFQFTTGVPRMRGQTRYNITGAGSGTDIYAHADDGTPTLNDGNWHMLTWTFDTTTGQLKSYFDANLVDTFNSLAANFNMIAGSSTVGTFGLKGDSGNFINGTVVLDEVWIDDRVLNVDQVRVLYNNLIPEPATLALIGLGLVSLAHFRHRRGA